MHANLEYLKSQMAENDAEVKYEDKSTREIDFDHSKQMIW